jgi:hypothetical protein
MTYLALFMASRLKIKVSILIHISIAGAMLKKSNLSGDDVMPGSGKNPVGVGTPSTEI